jgi:hypothetical protein
MSSSQEHVRSNKAMVSDDALAETLLHQLAIRQS